MPGTRAPVGRHVMIDLTRENVRADRPALLLALSIGAPGSAAAIEALSYGAGFPLPVPVALSLVGSGLFVLAVARLISWRLRGPDILLLDECGVCRTGKFDLPWSDVIRVAGIDSPAKFKRSGILRIEFANENAEYRLTARTRREIDAYLRRHQPDRYR